MAERNFSAVGGLYPWLLQTYRRLVFSFQQGRGPSAHIMYSLPGFGATQLFAVFAARILCRTPCGEYPCGHCDSCILMTLQSHPDCLALDGEKEKGLIGIEQVRLILPRIYGAAQQGVAKVVGIWRGEKLSAAASDALLKTLEEPPGETYFLFFCQNPDQLPATIRSRCQQWNLGTPERKLVVSWLMERVPATTPEQISSTMGLSCGAPLAALRLLDGDLALPHSSLLQQLDKALCCGDMLFLLNAFDHSENLVLLYWLSILFFSAIKSKLVVRTEPLGEEQTALIDKLARHFTYEQLALCRQLFLECRHELAQLPQLNQKLLLTELLCKCQEVLFI